MSTRTITVVGAAAAGLLCGESGAFQESDYELVTRLDIQFQAAVKTNDAPTMDRILHKDMILVLGNGEVNTRAQLLQEARDKSIVYEQQDEDPGTQTVRIWGNTAIVTARLWIKGVSGQVPFDRRVWFSDTYVRTPEGWRYFFGQVGSRT